MQTRRNKNMYVSRARAEQQRQRQVSGHGLVVKWHRQHDIAADAARQSPSRER